MVFEDVEGGKVRGVCCIQDAPLPDLVLYLKINLEKYGKSVLGELKSF
jgi:hypothetical protein